MDECARDDQSLLLTARELVNLGVGAVGKIELLEQRHRLLRRHVARNAEVRRVKNQIFNDVQSAVGVRPLRDDADAPPNLDRIVDNVGAGNRSVPRGRRDAGRENAERRRLPGPVRTQQSEELSVPNVQVEALQGDNVRARHARRPLTRADCGGRPAGRAPAPPWCRRRGIHLPKRLRFDG